MNLEEIELRPGDINLLLEASNHLLILNSSKMADRLLDFGLIKFSGMKNQKGRYYSVYLITEKGKEYLETTTK